LPIQKSTKENSFNRLRIEDVKGYHFYKQTKNVAMLQNILNHLVPNITLRYIGITQDMTELELNRLKL